MEFSVTLSLYPFYINNAENAKLLWHASNQFHALLISAMFEIAIRKQNAIMITCTYLEVLLKSSTILIGA